MFSRPQALFYSLELRDKTPATKENLETERERERERKYEA
jgi:hypothetical protein